MSPLQVELTATGEQCFTCRLSNDWMTMVIMMMNLLLELGVNVKEKPKTTLNPLLLP